MFRQESSKTPGEGIVFSRDARFGQGIEESGFADVGQTDDTAFERHMVFLWFAD